MPDWVAVISDIHGNLPALDAVLADIGTHGVAEKVCLGDVVGYGGSPGGCIDRLQAAGVKVIKGNHDAYAATAGEISGVNDLVKQSIAWTRAQLTPGQREWLGSLPMMHEGPDYQAVHASLNHPEAWGYVHSSDAARLHFAHQTKILCFIGHSHVPKMFVQGDAGALELTSLEGVRQDRKQVVNVGSVGQPRDGDPRACYLLYRRETRDVWWRRVPYDIEAAQRAIADAGLPGRHSLRLSVGK